MILPSPQTTEMSRILLFHEYLMIILIGILTFVGIMLILICYRLNPEFVFFQDLLFDTENNANKRAEIVWTIVPILLLAAITFPSFKLLYQNDEICTFTAIRKVIGSQWFWTYENRLTSNPSNIAIDLVPRQLSADTSLDVSVGESYRLIITSNDVIHSWSIPCFGIKTDAIPGRLNGANLLPLIPGVSYGQCSELCGVSHANMPCQVYVSNK